MPNDQRFLVESILGKEPMDFNSNLNQTEKSGRKLKKGTNHNEILKVLKLQERKSFPFKIERNR